MNIFKAKVRLSDLDEAYHMHCHHNRDYPTLILIHPMDFESIHLELHNKVSAIHHSSGIIQYRGAKIYRSIDANKGEIITS